MDLSPGFADPVAGAQACFRAVLDAMARPGQIRTVEGVAAPAPLCDAAAAVLLTLADHETPLWLDPGAAGARGWIGFHTGAPEAALGLAAFAMALSLPDLGALTQGTDESPEASATVILQIDALGRGARYVLEGPGLREPGALLADGLPPGFAAAWAANRARFPLGVDIILCAGDRLAALPRSVSIREG